MMPIKHILEKATSARQIDLEIIGGLLEYHGISIAVSNQFSSVSSDPGDKWSCSILSDKGSNEFMAPSLREAVLKALEFIS